MAQPTIDQVLKEMAELYPKPFVWLALNRKSKT